MQKKLLCLFNKILVMALGILLTYNATAADYWTDEKECQYFEWLYLYGIQNRNDDMCYNGNESWLWEACGGDSECLSWYDWYANTYAGPFNTRLLDILCNNPGASLYEAANEFGIQDWCGFSDGDDGCDDLSSCPNFEGWQSTGAPGYEEYRISSNDSCWCMENYVQEYRCASGYIGYTTDGQTGCTRYTCPSGACCGIALQPAPGNEMEPVPNVNVFLQTSDTMPNPSAGGYFYGVTTGNDGIFQIDHCTSIINSYGTNGRMYLRAAAVGYVPHEEWINSSNMSSVSAIMYEDLATDDNVSCTNKQYREYNKTTKASVCKACPSINGIQGTNTTNQSGQHWYRIYDCYIPTTQSFTDTTGTWKFDSACYYTEN